MDGNVIIWALICGTICFIAVLVFVYNYWDKNGSLGLERVENGIAAEKLKAENQKLLAGKYIG